MNFEDYLYNKVCEIIKSWTDKNIYAISFFVSTNECNTFKGISNFPEFSVGYNTEEDCENASTYSEERWNFAFWSQNNLPVIDCEDAVDGAENLLDWYDNIHLTGIGIEDSENDYDEDCNYIGKGPTGYYELLCLVSEIARKIQSTDIVKAKWGNIPIIVHDLEYPWYVSEATANANPHGEADVFLQALRNNFCEAEDN